MRVGAECKITEEWSKGSGGWRDTSSFSGRGKSTKASDSPFRRKKNKLPIRYAQAHSAVIRKSESSRSLHFELAPPPPNLLSAFDANEKQ